MSKQIAAFFQKNHNFKIALVLIPPSDYFKERGVDFDVPEPAVFYYYTGLKTTWITSPDTAKANWMIIAGNGHYKIVPVLDKSTMYDSIKVFKKYPVRL